MRVDMQWQPSLTSRLQAIPEGHTKHSRVSEDTIVNSCAFERTDSEDTLVNSNNMAGADDAVVERRMSYGRGGAGNIRKVFPPSRGSLN